MSATSGDPRQLTVQMVHAHSWREGRVVPLGEPFPVGQWLDLIATHRMTPMTLPFSRIVEGPWDGGHAVAVDGPSGRDLFLVPAAAIPLLVDWLPPDDYADLLRRTPQAGGVG